MKSVSGEWSLNRCRPPKSKAFWVPSPTVASDLAQNLKLDQDDQGQHFMIYSLVQSDSGFTDRAAKDAGTAGGTGHLDPNAVRRCWKWLRTYRDLQGI